MVNWVPARVTVALALASSGSRERAAQAWDAVRRDAPAHPSPNGGVVEAAFAGVLGVRLGGSNTYDGRTEDRGVLGTGPSAGAPDIDAATRLARLVSAGSLAVAVAVSVAVRGPARGRPRRRR
jgi:adenosylcobinamide-phosphate synthase